MTINLASAPATASTAVLNQISPSTNFAWRGRWPNGSIEPWRLLYDHELVLFQAGKCRVTFAEEVPQGAPLTTPGLARPNAPAWSAVHGAKAEPWRAQPLSGTIFPCPAGTFLIIPPNMPHMTIVDEGPVQRTCLHFDWMSKERTPTPLATVPPERPDPRLVRAAPTWIPRAPWYGPIRARRTIDDLAEKFFNCWNTRRQDERLVCRALLLELLVRLLSPDDDVQASATPELAHAIKLRLDQHLTDPIALPELLSDLDRRYEHLCRIFAATFGVPPLRYLTAARIERAKLLLREPDAQVRTVTRQLGYSDPAYFSRLFRAQVGVSPALFIRSQILPK